MRKKQASQKKKTEAKKQAPQKSRSAGPAASGQQAIGRLAGIGAVVALLVVIVMMIASVFFPDAAMLAAPRAWIGKVITPVQSLFSKATDGVVAYLRTLKIRSNLEYEYEQSRILIEELQDQAMLAEHYRLLLETYKDLDDEISRNIDLQGVKANIIARGTDNFSYTFTIDAGKNQGVDNYMAVVFSGALVGYTYDVKDDTAQVRGIVDSSANVPTLIESNRDQGYVKGTLAIDGTYSCRMYYFNYTSLPRPGDRVVTSGVGIEFIKGIPVGEVVESTRNLDDSKQYIVIKPYADFEHLEHVVVFRYKPAYAEEAPDNRTQAQSTFVPLPSIQPVPTYIGQPEPALTPGPDGLIPEISEGPSPTPAPTDTPTPTRDPNATVPPPNYEYNQKQIVLETLPPLVETLEPVSTPEPTPTFSVSDITVEEDP